MKSGSEIFPAHVPFYYRRDPESSEPTSRIGNGRMSVPKVDASLFSLLSLLFFLTITVAEGQNDQTFDDITLSPVVAYEFGLPQSIQRSAGVVNIGSFETEGTGISANHSLQLGFDLQFPHALDADAGILFELHLLSSEGFFNSDQYENQDRSIAATTKRPIGTVNRFEVRSSELQVRAGVMVNLFDLLGLTLSGGTWASYRIGSNVTETEQILSPDTALFAENMQRSRVIAAGDQITSFEWRFGGVFRASHSFPLARHLALSPFLASRVDFESLFDKGLGYRSFTGSAGISLDLNLEEDRFAPPPPPLPPDRVRLDLFNATPGSIAGDTVLIRQKETGERIFLALPTFYQVREEEMIPNPSLSFPLNEDEAASFQPEGLAQLPLRDLLTRSVDLIAYRLRLSGDSLTIVERGGTGGLITREGERLFEYLTGIWKIEPGRITRRTESDVEMADQQGLELLSTSATLFDPLLLQRQVNEFEHPEIGLRKDIELAGRMISWHVRLRDGETEIASFGSDQSENGYVFTLTGIGESGRLNGELEVIGEDGRQILAYDTLSYLQISEQNGERSLYFFGAVENDRRSRTVEEAFVRMIAAEADSTTAITLSTGPGRDLSREPNGPARTIDLAQQILQRIKEENGTVGMIRVNSESGDADYLEDSPWECGVVVRVERR